MFPMRLKRAMLGTHNCSYIIFMSRVTSLSKNQQKTVFRDGGGRWRGTRAEGQEGKMLVAENRELQ